MRMFQFQGKAQLTSAQGQLYCSSKVSPTLFQTDLRITDHTGHKFSLSLTLLSVQNSNRMASWFTTIASFPSVFLQLLQCSRQHPSFSAHWAALMTKTELSYPALSLRFVDFTVQFWFHCKFHSTRSDSRDKFDSGVIFLDQSQSFASHSNQWDCFLLYRS